MPFSSGVLDHLAISRALFTATVLFLIFILTAVTLNLEYVDFYLRIFDRDNRFSIRGLLMSSISQA